MDKMCFKSKLKGMAGVWNFFQVESKETAIL